MPISYKRELIGKGIALTEITDAKFKSNTISVSFIAPTEADKAPLNTLVAELLASSNAKLPSLSALSKELGYLYGATLTSRSRRIGDVQENGLCIDYICDDYTIGKEVISQKAVQLLLDCLFDPQLEECVFAEKQVATRRQELIDSINAELNDKFGYAMKNAKKIIYKDEPACCSLNGTVENARTITSQQITDRYYELIKTAQIEIVMCGREFEKVKPMLRDAFGKLDRSEAKEIIYKALSPIKPQTARKKESSDVNQSRLIMAFKSDCEDVYVAKVFAAVLGGTPFSKLFLNVREKMSLCYYCSAGYSDIKGTLIVSSGVEKENIEKAEKAILEQIEAVRNGDFTQEELENAEAYLSTGFKSNNDSIYKMSEYYIAQNTRGTAYSPEEVCEMFGRITKQQVVECAKTFVYDTFYAMESQEVSDDE